MKLKYSFSQSAQSPFSPLSESFKHSFIQSHQSTSLQEQSIEQGEIPIPIGINQSRRFTLLLILTLAALLSFDTNATIRYVSKTGNSTPPYLTWETAADSIQECIDYSVANDTIYVANGTYKEKLIIHKFLTIIGAGWDSCIIDARDFQAPSNFQAVEISGNCIFKGFYLEVSNSYYDGSGVYVGYADTVSLIEYNRINRCSIGIDISTNSRLTVKHNIITNTSTGIYNFSNVICSIDSNIIIPFNHFSTGIHSWTGAIIRNNFIYCYNGGEGITNSYPYLVLNNIVIQRYTGNYGCYFAVGEGLIANNNVIGNFSESPFAVFRGDNRIVNNSIMNSIKGYKFGYLLGSNTIFQYNQAWNIGIPYTGLTPDSTNLIADPMFVSEDSADFHLQMYSPLIDRGDPEILDIDGSRSDIGAFGGPLGERYPYLDLPPREPVNFTAVIDSGIIKLKWNKNTEADFSRYIIYRDTVQNFSLDSNKIIAVQADTFFNQFPPLGARYLYYKITAADNQNNQSEPSEEKVIVLVGVDNKPVEVVNDNRLYQNYPNPFNSSTIIGYRLEKRGYIKLAVYDIKGELISQLVNENKEAGYYEKVFNIKDYPSGVYLYKVDIIGENHIPIFTEMRKMVYIK